LSLTLSPFKNFGAAAAGIDIRRPLSAGDVEEIVAAMDEHAVLVFRHGAPLNDDEQINFGRALGPVQHLKMLKMLGGGKTLLDRSELIDVGNLDENGDIVGADDRRRHFHDGNLLWHSDVTFDDNRAVYSILSARVIPPDGGDTGFADMRLAYDALSADKQSEIEDLVAEHSIWYSRKLGGFTDISEEEMATRSASHHALVHANPRTHRKALYLASHASHIIGWPESMGRALLDALTEHATQDEFTYTHKWQAGDVVMWDNLATMHRATEFDSLTQIRDMRRVTTLEREMTV